MTAMEPFPASTSTRDRPEMTPAVPVPAHAPQPVVNVDPSVIPWSYRGSNLSLNTRTGSNGRLTHGNDICLVSQKYPYGLPVFAMRPQIDDAGKDEPRHAHAPSGFPVTPSPATFKGSPSRMTWISPASSSIVVEATFVNPTTIRFRGTVPFAFNTEGSLAVDHWRCWAFSVPTRKGVPAQVEFTSTPNFAARFIATRGRLVLENGAPFDPGFANNNRRITVEGDGPEGWDLLLIERDVGVGVGVGAASAGGDSPLSLPRTEAFEDDVARMDADFIAYARRVCTGETALEMQAAYLMWTSTVRAGGFLGSEAVLMSKQWMNKVWSWDNCFNGLALAKYDLDLGLSQILLPFDHITSEGRLPDSINYTEILYDFTKPPIYGWTFFTLLSLLDPRSTEADPSFDVLSRARLVEVYSKVSAFTRFWYNHRATTVSDLPWYSHGNDSGWDNATAYDQATMCVSPDLAAFLVVQCDFLAKLGRHLDENADDYRHWETQRDRTLRSLVSELWSETHGQFLFKHALDGTTWTSTSLLRCMPLVAAAHLPPEIVTKMVSDLSAFTTPWGLATEEVASELYEADGYWRGPIWAPVMLLLESSLRAVGDVAAAAATAATMADDIRDNFFKLCEKGGFAENYDALEGCGNRDLSYTWSASAFLVMKQCATRG